ncbi:MAG TPA: sugar phosphate isomerase/epimerase [Bryobacteraceae bacterium]|nr:sugar phosphate isomerase/epimerase [Bryobacteraceae bacterium]
MERNLSRRTLLASAAGVAASALPATAATGRGQLGCMTMLYRAHPLDTALQGIRKAGFQYVVPARAHAGKDVFAPAMPSAARAELKAKLKDHGLTANMSLGGFGPELGRPGGLEKYIAELDLCADFGIPVIVGGGPWYFQKWPNLPKSDRDWQKEVAAFYNDLEKAVRHAGSVKVIITLKPHTGITARAKECMEVVKRLPSEWLKICWDAGNVSFYEGIYPDPDLPDLAPHVKAVCIKDHLGGRAEGNFPLPGAGQIDHDLMFRTLFGAGFNGPMGVEKVEGRDNVMKMPAAQIDERVAQAYNFLTAAIEKASS